MDLIILYIRLSPEMKLAYQTVRETYNPKHKKYFYWKQWREKHLMWTVGLDFILPVFLSTASCQPASVARVHLLDQICG